MKIFLLSIGGKIGDNTMQVNKFNLYNNDAIIAMLVYNLVRRERKVNIAKIAVLLPILTNDSLLNAIVYKSENLENIISLHREQLHNYTAQYSATLPILINSISLLIDLKIVDIQEDDIVLVRNLDDDIELSSHRLDIMTQASFQLFNEIKLKPLSFIYKRLKVLL